MAIFIEVFSIAMFENQRVLQSAASPGTTFLGGMYGMLTVYVHYCIFMGDLINFPTLHQ